MPHLITAIIKPFKLDELKTALQSAGAPGMSVSELQGYGRQGGKTETFRGSEYTVDYIPKVRVDLIVGSSDVDAVVALISETCRTGKIGDGKIWTIALDSVTRIRTGEMGDDAI